MISVVKPGSPTEILEDLYPLDDFRRKPGSPEDVLTHVGVKGMKWGVRKAKETSADISSGVKSLKVKNQARKESNAKEHVAKAAIAQKRINDIKANPSRNLFVQSHRDNKVKELEIYRDQRLKDAKDIRADRLTDHQKKVLIGVGVAGVVIAAYGTYKVVDYGIVNQFKTRDIPFKRNEKLTGKMSADRIMKDVVEPINPDYGGSAGMGAHFRSMMNCRRCTLNYEMRRRGMDVQATKTMTASGQTVAGLMRATDPNSNINTSGVSVLGKWASRRGKVAEAMKTSHGLGEKIDLNYETTGLKNKAENIFEAISKQPEGARGELGLGWRSGGAHSMAWEVINGKAHVFDTQTRTRYDVRDFQAMISENVKDAGITRLDNAPLNEGFLRRWAKNVA